MAARGPWVEHHILGGCSWWGVVFWWGIGKAEVACGVVLEGNGQATGLWPGRQVRPPQAALITG